MNKPTKSNPYGLGQEEPYYDIKVLETSTRILQYYAWQQQNNEYTRSIPEDILHYEMINYKRQLIDQFGAEGKIAINVEQFKSWLDVNNYNDKLINIIEKGK
jgi:hypothetical protein